MFSVRVILWTAAMAYTGFILTNQGLRPFNSLSITEALPRGSSRIFPGYHVYSQREAATKTRVHRAFHRANLPGLGHIPRKPRLTSVAKGMIPTGRLSRG